MLRVNQLSGFGARAEIDRITILQDLTLAGADGGFVNFTIRCVVPDLADGGTQIRVTLRAGVSEDCIIDNVAVGIRSGSTKDTTATPTEILFSGGSGVTITADTTEVSDWTTFRFNTAQELLVIVDISSNAGSDELRQSATGDGYYQTGASDSYNVATMPGSPSLVSGITYGVDLVEGRYV